MSSLLRLSHVIAGYGSATVLHGVEFDVSEGEVAVILGANGVGKTTTLRTVSGLLRPWKGTVEFDGHRLDRMSPEKIVGLGVGLVPEPPAIFRDLTAFDNLRVGAYRLGSDRRTFERRVEDVFATFPIVAERRDQLAGRLSGGEQRMLALGRALMAAPRMLLVDEVSMGLSPQMVSNVFRLLAGLRSRGITICMVEQNISALSIADRAYVMEKGRVVHEAQGADLERTRDEVAGAYLGRSAATVGGGRP
ncbi:MAG: ABC transporter ATP-binding protein [Actinomycetota bacterium]